MKPGTLVYRKLFWSTLGAQQFYGRVHAYKGGGKTYCGRHFDPDAYDVHVVIDGRTPLTCKRCRIALEKEGTK